jgi:hypothetical protein
MTWRQTPNHQWQTPVFLGMTPFLVGLGCPSPGVNHPMTNWNHPDSDWKERLVLKMEMTEFNRFKSALKKLHDDP